MKVRIGKNIYFQIEVFRLDRTPENFIDVLKDTIKVRITNANLKTDYFPQFTIKGNVVSFEYPGTAQQHTGIYNVHLYYEKQNINSVNGIEPYFLDFACPLALVDRTYKENDLLSAETASINLEGEIRRGIDGINGITPHINPENGNWFLGNEDTGVRAEGLSAYEVDKEQGFDGNVIDWLASLREPAEKAGEEVIKLTNEALIRVDNAIVEADSATDNANAAAGSVNAAVENLTDKESEWEKNEEKRIVSETERVNNERVRESNENSRKSNELSRQANETVRNTNEEQRKLDDSERQLNESSRIAAENLRKEAESQREQSEVVREEAENTRISDEVNRQNNENNRISNENTRSLAETKRETDETTRKNNETARVTAELNRESAFEAAITASEEQTENARIQAEYAKNQGDYAKAQGDAVTGEIEDINNRLEPFYPLEGTVLADGNTVTWTDGYYVTWINGANIPNNDYSFSSPVYVLGINKIRYNGLTAVNANPIILLDKNRNRIGSIPGKLLSTEVQNGIYTIPDNVVYIQCNCNKDRKSNFSLTIVNANDRITDNISKNSELTLSNNSVLNSILNTNLLDINKVVSEWKSAGIAINKGSDNDGVFYNVNVDSLYNKYSVIFKGTNSFPYIKFKKSTQYIFAISFKIVKPIDKDQIIVVISYTDSSKSNFYQESVTSGDIQTLICKSTFNKTVISISLLYYSFNIEGVNIYNLSLAEYNGYNKNDYVFTPAIIGTSSDNIKIRDLVINPLITKASYVKILPQSEYIGNIPEIGTNDFSYEILMNFGDSNDTNSPVLRLGNVNSYKEGGHTLYSFGINSPAYALFEGPENQELDSTYNSIRMLPNVTPKDKLQLWHIVLTRDKNVVTVYADGRKVGSVTQDKTLFIDNLLRLGNANKFVQCRFFRGALTEDDILKFFNNGRPFNYKLDDGYKFNTGKYKDNYTGQTEGVSEIGGTGPINVITEDNITFYRSHPSGVNYTGAYKFDITDGILNNKYVIVRCKIRIVSSIIIMQNIRIFATSITGGGTFELKSIPLFANNKWKEIELSFPVSAYTIQSNTYTGINSLFFIDGNNTGNSYDLDIADLEITKLNCIAEYIPAGLNITKWLDTSGNNNTLMSNGSNNLYYEEIYKDVITESGAPTISPDFVGQICIDTEDKTKYTAIYNPAEAQASVSDWVEK